MAGVPQAYELDPIYQLFFTDPIQLTSFTPFNNYFLLKALGILGQHDQALLNINLMWGGQIQVGATSFYETFSPQWIPFMNPNDPPPNGQNGYTSLCHPWACKLERKKKSFILFTTRISNF